MCLHLSSSGCNSFGARIILFFLGCDGSSLLRAGFLQLRRVGVTLRCGAWASHCGGFSCCGAWALGAWASVVAARGLSSCRMQALECTGFSSCGVWAQQLQCTGSGAQAQQLWRAGLVAPWHVGSSRTRDRTRVPCIGRRILNHCTTR